MLNIIQNLKAIQECLAPKLETKQSDDTPVSSAVPALLPEASLSQANRLSELYQDAMAEFNTRVQAFYKTRQRPEEAHPLIRAINEQLFILYNFPDNIMAKKDKEKVKMALKKIKEFQDEQSTRFSTLALEGNIDDFKQHYALYCEYISADFYNLLLDKLISEKDPQKQTHLLALADYLNDNDNHYPEFVSQALQKNKFPFSSKEIQHFIKVDDNSKFYHNAPASLLFKLYIQNSFNVFCTLLRHGKGENTWGILFEDQQSSLYTLFYNILLFSKPGYLNFLKELLTYPINPNDIHIKERNHQAHKERVGNLRMLKKAMPIIERNQTLRHVDPNLNTNIVMLLSLKSEVEGLTLILPKASLDNLAS